MYTWRSFTVQSASPQTSVFKLVFIRKSSLQTWNILSADILSAMFLNILSAMDWYLPIFYPGIGVYVNILSASPSRYMYNNMYMYMYIYILNMYIYVYIYQYIYIYIIFIM